MWDLACVAVFAGVCRYWAIEMKRKERGGSARLWMVIFKCIWFRLLVQGILMFLEVRFRFGSHCHL